MIETDNNTQRGAIMVEAAIYFPITIAVVMAVIYFGLFKMQESYFLSGRESSFGACQRNCLSGV